MSNPFRDHGQPPGTPKGLPFKPPCFWLGLIYTLSLGLAVYGLSEVGVDPWTIITILIATAIATSVLIKRAR